MHHYDLQQPTHSGYDRQREKKEDSSNSQNPFYAAQWCIPNRYIFTAELRKEMEWGKVFLSGLSELGDEGVEVGEELLCLVLYSLCLRGQVLEGGGDSGGGVGGGGAPVQGVVQAVQDVAEAAQAVVGAAAGGEAAEAPATVSVGGGGSCQQATN